MECHPVQMLCYMRTEILEVRGTKKSGNINPKYNPMPFNELKTKETFFRRQM